MSVWKGSTGDGPLAGLRVVEMATTLMGPYAALLLAQMGADVIKVETPAGDITRSIGDRRGVGLGAGFLNINRGKRSVVIDLKDGGDRALLFDLVATADVLSHNMRPSVADRNGLTYAALSERNPGLIVCRMFGFGQDGPYRERGAYDDVIQGASGTAALQGEVPQYVRSSLVDKTVGLMAVTAILAAHAERSRSGRGQCVDIPMFESMVAMNAMEQMGGLVYVPQDGPAGYSRTASPYRKPYATRDGYLAIMVYTDRQWQEFFALAGQPGLASLPKFATIRDRTAHIDELYGFLESVMVTRTSAEWLRAFEAADIPAMPVLGIADLVDDPQVQASGVFEKVDHPAAGTLRQPGLPWRFSRTATAPAGPAPLLGEHSAAVKAGLRDPASLDGRSSLDGSAGQA
jgi:crotonobetainyl-CoA:carnitine CoA-transferase CaiB-like acyl-CoA transferase